MRTLCPKEAVSATAESCGRQMEIWTRDAQSCERQKANTNNKNTLRMRLEDEYMCNKQPATSYTSN